MGLENIRRTFAFLVIVSSVTLCMHMPETKAQECVHPGGNVPFILHGDYNLSGNKNVADVQCAILVALWSLGGQQVAPPTCVVVPIALADIDCDSVYTVSDVLLATKLALSEPLDEVLDGDGDGCPDTCTACVPPEETSCFIAGVCYPEETTKADNSCLTCDSDNAALSWTTFADGTPCDENSGKLCASGLCAAVLPGAPTNVIATALDKAASVAFDPPTNNGGSPLLFFTVTSTPEGKTAIGAQSPVTITGLTNGIGYTFTVKATTAVGTGPNSEPSNLVTPTAACSEGLANCDDVEENGCEINVLTSMQHCGACNSPCDLANGSEVCAAGSCVLTTCDPGFGNCDQNLLNGCETEVLYSQQHCGACDTPCSPANGAGICVDGTCQLVDCLDNFADCDQNPQTGCEANLIASLDHCSACNSPCLLLNAVNTCAMSTCQIATCVLGFDNCDMITLTGCETNIASSLSNCGGCNIPCEPAHATGVCNQGSCLILECVAPYGNCDGDPGTGCETFTATSLEHCGSCNSLCSLQNATPKCTAGNCLIDKCMAGFGNCDNSDSTGCETSTLNSLAHCGGCNLPCQYANATATCAGGICQFGTCQTNFHNLDGLTNNGCEYACTFSSTTDLPDDTFKDANCDGIDGDPTKAVFVAKTGSAANPGTKSLPMATITQGIAKAVSLGRTQVYVSEGVYSERVTLVSGVSLYGGYSAVNGWARSASYVTEIQTGQVLGGRRSAMEGVNITAATTVDRFKIRTLASTGAGISSYGVYCQNCNALTLKNNVIEAAPGNEGGQGTVGGIGSGGTNGIGGGAGSCDTNTSGGAGGSAGTSDCGRSGGNGGKGGDHGDNDGASGGSGTGGTPGGSGGSGGDPGKAGGVGQGGANGTQGAHGGGGSGGSTATGFWVGNSGGSGLVGAHGNGGGGGGGGGGQGCFFCDNGPGNGGGGGGGGGCAGNGGSGGTAGGGSFGVFLVTSNGVVLSNNSITSSTGGNGGSGGNGGNGGTGGTGGAGGTVCTGEVGAGGNGGKGGNGGNGGAGG